MAASDSAVCKHGRRLGEVVDPHVRRLIMSWPGVESELCPVVKTAIYDQALNTTHWFTIHPDVLVTSRTYPAEFEVPNGADNAGDASTVSGGADEPPTSSVEACTDTPAVAARLQLRRTVKGTRRPAQESTHLQEPVEELVTRNVSDTCRADPVTDHLQEPLQDSTNTDVVRPPVQTKETVWMYVCLRLCPTDPLLLQRTCPLSNPRSHITITYAAHWPTWYKFWEFRTKAGVLLHRRVATMRFSRQASDTHRFDLSPECELFAIWSMIRDLLAETDATELWAADMVGHVAHISWLYGPTARGAEACN